MSRRGARRRRSRQTVQSTRKPIMNSIIWIVGAVVIVLFVAGFFGLR
jgi:hypothetical protein